MAKHTTITEEYSLPSRGLIYGQPFNPDVKFRSMTVEDEMKRLSPSTKPWKNMADIIDDCLITKLPISAYNLCMGDYTYLLHKLRITTYGADYSMRFVCPHCGAVKKFTVNLDELKVNKYDDKVKELMVVELPKSGHRVKLRFQTPRDLDEIDKESKEMKERFPDMTYDPTYLLTIQSLIAEIDDEPVNPGLITETLKELPMMDSNILVQTATKLNNMVGIDASISIHCDHCNNDVVAPFLFDEEFFRPSIG